MFRLFEGTTADDVWQKIACAFRAEHRTIHHRGRGGDTQEILHVALSIANPRQRWVVSREPAMNPAFAIAEVIWILTGRNDSRFLNYFNSRLPDYAGREATYHGAYGYRLRRHFGIDQLERAYKALAANPQSRQVVLQIWDSQADLPSVDGIPSSEDVPCNIISMLKVRDSRLEWTQVMRSNDVFRGLPHNIVQFTSVQEVLAGWLNIDVGNYHQLSDSLHVYEETLNHIHSSMPCVVEENSDSLATDKQKSESLFMELSKRTETIIDAGTSVEELVDMVQKVNFPPAFRNMLCVLCAEGARRRKNNDAAMEIMQFCSNATYSQLFTNWRNRCQSQIRQPGKSVEA